MKNQTLRLHPDDDVAVALKPLAAGTALEGFPMKARDSIPAGHKIALHRIEVGRPISKFNQIIGFSGSTILPGQHVHTHNVTIYDFCRNYDFGADIKPVEPVSEPATFEGYVRENGRVGTRNFIGILTSVNCSASEAKYIAREFEKEPGGTEQQIDGVAAFTRGTGCGMNINGEGLQLLRRNMTGYANHPNFAGVLVAGLG